MGIFGKGSDEKARPAAPAAVSPGAAAPAPRAVAKPAGSACVIGAQTRIKGELSGDEDVVVEGRVDGDIRIQRDLRIAAGGIVRAGVAARSVVVSGELHGDCSAEQRVEIQASGKLVGNIKAPRIVVAEGAVFRGNSDMSPDAQKARAAS
jgi:cytoskeletal protein CcmA (bactofilin family)